MHDLAAERILLNLAPYYGEGEGVRALIRGFDGHPGRLDFDASIREGSGRIFVYLKPGLSAQLVSITIMALGALCGGCRERQDDERYERACERHQRRSAHA